MLWWALAAASVTVLAALLRKVHQILERDGFRHYNSQPSSQIVLGWVIMLLVLATVAFLLKAMGVI